MTVLLKFIKQPLHKPLDKNNSKFDRGIFPDFFDGAIFRARYRAADPFKCE